MNLNTTRNRYIVPPTAGEAQSFEHGLFGDEPAIPSHPLTEPVADADADAGSAHPKKPVTPPKPNYPSR